jgi:hypothetical protein
MSALWRVLWVKRWQIDQKRGDAVWLHMSMHEQSLASSVWWKGGNRC